MLTQPLKLLRQYFGYSDFREGQPEIISAIVSGRDALGIMPTGAGKSICFQIPAMMAEGAVIVVSPLISLMRDQVEALRQAGLPAAFINSTLTAREYRDIVAGALKGEYKLIYIAPERLENLKFLSFLNDIRVSMVTVDEAHCVSRWGHDFRPSYLRIAEMTDMFGRRPVVSAFTATATPAVKEDIVRLLRLNDPVTVVTGFDRKNLYFEVERPGDKMRFTLDYVRKNSGKSGIVYCITRKLVESVHEKLKAAGVEAVRYHAGLDMQERKAAQDSFIYDKAGVIVATNAFGMGIDKSNVRYVLHYNMPKDMESYYQEAGRAGRDGEKADCVLLYSGSDIVMNKFLIEKSDRDAGGQKDKSHELRKLSQMIEYCSTPSCLRDYFLKYFGEAPKRPGCGNCGNCLDDGERSDVTNRARTIFLCLTLMGCRFGSAFTAEILRGENRDRAKEYGFDRLSVYGAMKDVAAGSIKDMISALAAAGYIKVDESQYRTLSLTAKGVEALGSDEKIMIRYKEKTTAAGRKTAAHGASSQKAAASVSGSAGKSGPAPGAYGSKYSQAAANIDRAKLFDRLRALRRELADKQRVPPYLIFSDAALNGMCESLPSTAAGFLEVSGVGQRKLEQYGKTFMAEIARFMDENA